MRFLGKIMIKREERKVGSKFFDTFASIAPAIAELFGDEKMGFFTTDLTKFLMVHEHNTELPLAKQGQEFNEKGAAYRVIQSKKPLIMELPASLYGRPIKVACFPVFDDDDPDKVVGTYGMAVTRDNAHAVRERDVKPFRGLGGDSSQVVRS